MRKKPEELRAEVGNVLSFLEEAGADFVVRRTKAALIPNAASGKSEPAPQAAGRDSSRLLAVQTEVLACQKCPLGRVRSKAVPGEGGLDSGLMFVGEAPGAEENSQGRPFVGRAGQLLTNIIKAMGFDRAEVFITNVIKCQPPGNRTPLSAEIDACTPYLLRQIEAIQPEVIVALGGVSAGFFVPGDIKISGLRGTLYDHGRVKVMPTFHPAYLLRNEGNRQIKKAVWDDMQKVMAFLGKK